MTDQPFWERDWDNGRREADDAFSRTQLRLGLKAVAFVLFAVVLFIFELFAYVSGVIALDDGWRRAAAAAGLIWSVFGHAELRGARKVRRKHNLKSDPIRPRKGWRLVQGLVMAALRGTCVSSALSWWLSDSWAIVVGVVFTFALVFGMLLGPLLGDRLGQIIQWSEGGRG